MSHDRHTADTSIRELTTDLCTLDNLRAMARDWHDPFPLPRIEPVSLADGRMIKVVRDDEAELGSKARFGSLLVQKMREDTIVYVAPRVGWAPISLAKLCKLYGKRLILFAPASAAASDHQRVAVELGAEMRFLRIAAMPVLQRKAQAFAERHGYRYAPLGLRDPLVTAAILATAQRLFKRDPLQVWTAMSTGVLNRGLQLAWPTAEVHGVAVARNIQAGEKGRAIIHSHPLPFLQDEKKELRPPFPSASNYDAKVWRYIEAHAISGAVFWNVAGEIQPQKPNKLKSDVAWGDESAFRRK